MLVDEKRQRKLAGSIATMLQRAGITQFRGVCVLVEVDDESSPTGASVMGSMSGDRQAIALMLLQQLRRMISEPVMVTPFGAAANDAPTPPDSNKGN